MTYSISKLITDRAAVQRVLVQNALDVIAAVMTDDAAPSPTLLSLLRDALNEKMARVANTLCDSAAMLAVERAAETSAAMLDAQRAAEAREAQETPAVRAPREELELLTFQLADTLCWANGFCAAVPDELSRHPPVEGVREIKALIEKTLRDTETTP